MLCFTDSLKKKRELETFLKLAAHPPNPEDQKPRRSRHQHWQGISIQKASCKQAEFQLKMLIHATKSILQKSKSDNAHKVYQQQHIYVSN